MAVRVRLNWADAVSVGAGYRVYRSDTPMNPASLPSPLADVGANVFEYVDESVGAGNTYYYRVSSYNLAREEVSAEIAVEATPSGGGWTPADATMAYWVEAVDDASFSLVSGSVSVWYDKSGNGINVAQSTSANRPMRITDAVDFDGTNDRLIFGESNLGRNTQAIVAAMVFKCDSYPASSAVIFYFAEASSSLARATISIMSDGLLRVIAKRLDGEGSTSVFSPAQIPLNTDVLVTLVADYQGGSLTMRLGGAVAASTATSWNGPTSNTASAKVAIGTNLLESAFFDGQVREIVVSHSLSDLTNIETYLNNRWLS